MHENIMEIIEMLSKEKNTSSPELKIVDTKTIIITECSQHTLQNLMTWVNNLDFTFISMNNKGLEIYTV